MAVKPNKPLESDNFDSPSPDDIKSELYIPEPIEIDVVAGATGEAKGQGGLSKQAQELLFNEEYVEVMLNETTDENAEQMVFTSCNGTPQYFQRGVVQRVKRKYLAILASCKEHNLSTPDYTAQDGSRGMSIRRTSSLKYPFMVISDPNPRGAAWLKSLLQAQT